MAVTVLLRPPGSERLRRRGRWRELRRREPLGLGDTKRPGGPAGLHGGCTESGLIRGTRLSELMTGLGFLPRAATIRPGRGAARPCGGGAEAAPRRGAPGRARGADRACLGLRPRLGPSALAEVAQLRVREGGPASSPSCPPPSPAAPGEAVESFTCPPEMGAGVGQGLGTRVCACACRRCAPAQPAPHPGS